MGGLLVILILRRYKWEEQFKVIISYRGSRPKHKAHAYTHTQGKVVFTCIYVCLYGLARCRINSSWSLKYTYLNLSNVCIATINVISQHGARQLPQNSAFTT